MNNDTIEDRTEEKEVTESRQDLNPTHESKSDRRTKLLRTAVLILSFTAYVSFELILES